MKWLVGMWLLVTVAAFGLGMVTEGAVERERAVQRILESRTLECDPNALD
jgi:hypothetical protein